MKSWKGEINCFVVPNFWMYNKNCGKKMFGKKIYPAPEENLANQVAFKNMGGKMIEVMLKWVPNPKQFRRKEGTHEERNSKTPQHR